MVQPPLRLLHSPPVFHSYRFDRRLLTAFDRLPDYDGSIKILNLSAIADHMTYPFCLRRRRRHGDR